MSEIIQLKSLSLDTLTELAKESFADCQDALQVYLDNEKKLQRFGHILKACREKVPHGQWQQWVLETFAGHLSIRAVQVWIADAADPEKRQKRLESERERQQKLRAPKAQYTALLPEQPPAPPVSSGVIRHESQPSQPQKPAWLADPDELERPEEDDLPPLPKTNTHHTAQNRRTSDARETDRAGIVCPDDPRGLQDGGWYVWSDRANRLLPVTDEDVIRRFDQIRRERAPRAGQAMPVVPWPPKATPVVEPVKESVSSKRFIPPTADEVSAYSDEISAGVDGQQFVDFYESKGWMIGKNKMKDWKAAVRTWKRSESHRGSKITTAVRSNRNWDEEIPEWKPTE